jgi:diaminopimelate epimerase
MKRIPFVKYTSYGNNFVIVDELGPSVLSESEKSSFAYQATDVCYGVGSDNFLVLQRSRQERFREINTFRNYWDKLPDAECADYVFRMFEPDGSESFSCGNGLLCIADYLHTQYGIQSARIMTELPTAEPKVVTIGANPRSGMSWANLGHPRKISPEVAAPSSRNSLDADIDVLENIPVHFRRTEGLRFFDEPTVVNLTGYMVAIGEPHLVVFTESGFSRPDIADRIFASSSPTPSAVGHGEKRKNTTSALVEFIGSYFPRVLSHIFPVGINVNFVRIRNNGVDALEYRCFERGINRETLACGTGAIASSFIARRLKLLDSKTINVWPHRCRWHDPNVEIHVKESDQGWFLHGNPTLLFEGVFSAPIKSGPNVV